MLEYRKKEEFYIDNDFGEIPKGWTLKRFSKCFELFPTASYSRENLSDVGDCCCIHYGDIHTKFDGFLDFQKEKLPFVSEKMASRYAKIKDGDLIIADASEDYDGVGKAVEVLNLGDKLAIAGLHTLHLRAIDDCLINGFKGYVLNNGKVRNKILRSATGIKVYSVSKSSLKNILIPIPSHAEQRTIASILSKVDEAIAATKNSITKAERLKKALMQTLLTGKLRPDGIWRKDDEFQEIKMGLFPKEWEIKTVSQISTKVTDGEHTTPIRVEKGNYLLSARNIKNGYLDLSDVDYVDDVELKKIQKRCNPEKGDLFISCSGTLGNVCMVPEGLNCGLVRSVALVKVRQDIIEPEFVEILFQTPFMYKQMMISVSSSVQGNLFQGAIKKLKVPYPSEKERLFIIDKFKGVNKAIKSKQEKIQKLERLKKVLMQNLLTGKVRVKVPKEQLQTETR